MYKKLETIIFERFDLIRSSSAVKYHEKLHFKLENYVAQIQENFDMIPTKIN